VSADVTGKNLTLIKTTYSISLSKIGTYTFTAATVGYNAPTPESVTIANTGNQATGILTIALTSGDTSSFTLNKTSITNIAVSGTDTFTVRPNTGLTAGTYTATVTVSGGNGIIGSFNVSFTVTTVSYTTFSNLKNAIVSASSEAVLYVSGTINWGSTNIQVNGKTITLRPTGGDAILHRPTTYTDDFFYVSNGGELILEGEGVNKIILDGNKAAVNAGYPLIRVYGGELTLKTGSVLQNNKNTSSIYGDGGAVNASYGSTVTLEGGEISGNEVT
jgi:hypothetical protein